MVALGAIKQSDPQAGDLSFTGNITGILNYVKLLKLMLKLSMFESN
jgi:hypothetical protein